MTPPGAGYLVDCDVRRLTAGPAEPSAKSTLQGSPLAGRLHLHDGIDLRLRHRENAARWLIPSIVIVAASIARLRSPELSDGVRERASNEDRRTKPNGTVPTVRFTIDPPPGHVLVTVRVRPTRRPNVETTTLAVSPDGTRVAMVAADASGRRGSGFAPSPGSEVADPLPTTDGARSVFWSPDGRSIGFPAGGKAEASRPGDRNGGVALRFAAHPGGVYGTWGADAIVYSAVPESSVCRPKGECRRWRCNWSPTRMVPSGPGFSPTAVASSTWRGFARAKVA